MKKGRRERESGIERRGKKEEGKGGRKKGRERE